VSDDEIGRAVALLEANHKFPTEYSFTVITISGDEIEALVVEAAFQDDEPGDRQPGAHEKRPSAGGKYVSHRLVVRVVDAHHVLRIYARLRAVDGVRTIL
jgi:putative lipoic acid-binding regulatory protein